MVFTLRIEAHYVGDGWELALQVAGSFVWGGTLKWGGLDKGDVNLPPSDDNPAGLWAAIIGRISEAMKQLGATDSDPGPLIYAGTTADPGVMCAFQTMCHEATSELLTISYRKAAKHGSKLQPGLVKQAWNKAAFKKK